MPKIKKTVRFRSELLIFPLLAILCAAAYFITIRLEPYEISSSAQGNEIVEESISDTTPYITDTKCARLYDGKIGIYDCYGNLEYTLFTDVTFLPRADRLALYDGIVFESEAALCEFIESLDS